jgi:hypothetical protein
VNVLYVWMLVTTFYCADQDPQFQEAARACHEPWPTQASQHWGRRDKGDLFRSQDACEAAAAKVRRDNEELDTHVKEAGSPTWLSPVVSCKRVKVKS